MKTFVYPIESILQVHDGDTLTARYKTRPDTTVQETIRLKGVDTHELGGENADKAKKEKEYTKKWLDHHHNLKIRVFGRGSFGRVLAKIYGEENGELDCLNEDLLKEFEGIRYNE